MEAPIFLLARDDELVAPAQLFATEHLVGTKGGALRKEMVPLPPSIRREKGALRVLAEDRPLDC